MPTRQYIEISPAKLRPNSSNVRTHSKGQIAELASTIRHFGFTNPILADENHCILAGHARWQAAKQLGLRAVSVIILSGLTPAQRRALVLFDNKIGEKAGWDRAALPHELDELSSLLGAEGLDLSLTGFEAPEIDQLLGDLIDPEHDPADDFALPHAGEIAVSKVGDLWCLGRHRIACGDATEDAAVRTLMGRDRASMVFADAPYNLRISSIQGRGRTRHRDFVQGSGELSTSAHIRLLTDSFSLAAKFCLAGSLHYLSMDWRHVREMLAAGDKVYDELLNIAVWNKTNAGQGSFYRSQYELIFIFKFGSAPHRNNIELGRHGRNRSNLWTYACVNTFRAGRLDDLALHPTVKPVALIADAIRDCTKRGNIVLDPFLGSGSTILAAERVGRLGYTDRQG
jgi:DNA modification methylase